MPALRQTAFDGGLSVFGKACSQLPAGVLAGVLDREHQRLRR